MGVCTLQRVVYDISCKRLQFFVNVEALFLSIYFHRSIYLEGSIKIECNR